MAKKGSATSSRRNPCLKIIQAKDYGGMEAAILSSETSDDLWYAETDLPIFHKQIDDPWLWDCPPRKYDLALLYPKFDKDVMTIAPKDDSFYTKRLNLVSEGLKMFDRPHPRSVTLQEIEVCESICKRPHPNICQYRGVEVDPKNRVTGLVFDRYDMSVYDAQLQGHRIDTARCLRHVESAITHLHTIGYVHCDIKAENIFVNLRTQTFVLGDFDATHREGAFMSLKVGTPGWVPNYEDTDNLAQKEIDWYSLEMLKAWWKVKFHTPGGSKLRTTDILARAGRAIRGE
ncbi:hypothetical protein CC86DRAFT_372024 [Ophiobolus disseminans]|uniref:Protein kinase domain-containing protein n=1 Tax=Ophiobolus disseminans TaxID=1469910 RepID=A0A6A6ZRX6_9PLEO|nr:hypothetical protein CC86DRAFT_372024 [Ophiobolus disseminans]